MKEQISEDFAKELIANIIVEEEASTFYVKREKIGGDWITIHSSVILNHWKQKGYIKQSREEEIREEIEEFINSTYFANCVAIFTKNKIDLLVELIEILDNKDKNK